MLTGYLLQITVLQQEYLPVQVKSSGSHSREKREFQIRKQEFFAAFFPALNLNDNKGGDSLHKNNLYSTLDCYYP